MLKIWDTYWKLTITWISPIRKWWQITYECLCSCGTTKNIAWRDLRTGNSTSCGCYAIEYRKNRYTIHGESRTPFGKRFRSIQERCYNPNNKSYKDYGWRWIKCQWKTLEEFKNDMYASYLEHLNIHGQKNTTIERIDIHGDYCTDNCIWATKLEQSWNTRRTVKVMLWWSSMCYTHAIKQILWYRGYSSVKERWWRTHQEMIDYLVQDRVPRR